MSDWKRTLTILIFVQFVSAIGMSSVFPFLPLYVEELGTQTGLSVELMAGLVYSAQAFTMMLAAPIWGALADRHGRKPMVVRATIGGGIVIALMAFVRSAEELVLLRAIQGLITGVFPAITALAAANVPRDRMGYSLGMLQVGLWGGISLGPLVGGVMADMFGYSAAFVVTAALLFIAGTLAWLNIEEHFEPLPQSAGQRRGFVAAWRHVLSMPGVPATYAARFLSRLGRTLAIPFTPLFVQELMPDADHVATITGVISGVAALAGTMGAIYLGRLGDRIGHRRVLITMALVAACFYAPQGLVVAVWQLFILQTLTGGTEGGIMPSLSTLLARYTEPGEEGAVYGLESSIMAAARSIAPLLGAALASWFGLRSVYVAAGVALLATALLAHRWLPTETAESVTPGREPAAAK